MVVKGYFSFHSFRASGSVADYWNTQDTQFFFFLGEGTLTFCSEYNQYYDRV